MPLLSGQWRGHYIQRDEPRGIVADLRQEGSRLLGTMRDERTHFELSVYEMAAECGLPPGSDEQIVQTLRQGFPEEGKAPIRALMTLPDEAHLDGEVQGVNVTFKKVYQGEAFSGYRVGDKQVVGLSVTDHTVHYRGVVKERGSVLEGIWWIEADPARGVRRSEGSFLLRRQ